MSIPYEKISTLFVDAGNTLVTMDFEWVASEIAARGHACDPMKLRRAEARARPMASALLAQIEELETTSTFARYLTNILEHMDSPYPEDVRTELVSALVPVLKSPEVGDRLWSSVLPGVPEALSRLRDEGVQLIVVSNADGNVERGLKSWGLRPYFEHVVDSGAVGFEKPDPRIFEHALKIAGARPDRTLHVGDMYSIDVVGARAAGLFAVLLDPYWDYGDVDCDTFGGLSGLARRILGG